MAKRSNKLDQKQKKPISKYQSMPLSKVKNLELATIMSLSRADLEIVTRKMAIEGNKRLTVLKKKGISSPSATYIKKHGGRFSVTKKRSGAKKDVTELRAEFQRAKGFLEAETSTVKGYKEWETKVATTLAEQGIDYASLTPAQKRRFWQAYSKIEELDRGNVVKGNGRYNTVINEIYTRVKKGLLKRDLDAFSLDVQKKVRGEMEKDFSGVLNLGANVDDNPWKS